MFNITGKTIHIESHAFFRMLERGNKFGLDYYETKKRAYSTIRNGKITKYKHKSVKHMTYYSYFSDNLSFYVICGEKENHILIKSVIIERRRE